MLFFFWLFLCSALHATYITGDQFRNHCQFISDNVVDFAPEEVKEGDLIFVRTDFLPRFFKEKHPNILHRYVLITGQNDNAIPGEFSRFLEDPKIIAWFGPHVEETFSHPKLHALPIGVAYVYVEQERQITHIKSSLQTTGRGKQHLLYLNFTLKNHPERAAVYALFRDKPFCFKQLKHIPYRFYIRDLLQSKFVLSPRGMGPDCWRTWEALCCGAIPILKTTKTADPLYEGLPVLFVNDWKEITEEFLNKKYEEILQKGSYQWDKLSIEYWLRVIDSYRS